MSAIQTNGSSPSDVRQFKVIVLGNMYTGKSNLVLRFAKGQFHSNVAPTIGAAFISQNVCLDDNSTIRLQMWDTAGHERFHSLVRFYFRGAAAAIVVYDITNQSSYQSAKEWIKEVQKELGPPTVIALAGNKQDLDSMRVVKYEEAQTYADENELLFMETSGKTANNVSELFLAVAEKLSKLEQITDPDQGIRITSKGDSAMGTNKSCCK